MKLGTQFRQLYHVIRRIYPGQQIGLIFRMIEPNFTKKFVYFSRNCMCVFVF